MLNHIPGQVTHFHLFGGSGSGAAGMNDADPGIGPIKGQMLCVGGIDVDPRACADFKMMTGVAQACVDLFSLQQYRAWWGRMPAPDWREATADTLRQAAHGHFPDIVFLSAPCKGFSGLLPAVRASTAKYMALNELTLRGVWLMLEAFADDLPGLVAFENVPRIASRGRYLLDQITAMLRHYGYATAETTHDCGELGGLGQSRRRFLLVARQVAKLPPFLFEPPKRALRSVGEVLGHMPLPGDPLGGPMHRVPALQCKTWVRLAFVEAGSDWRSLNRLKVEHGHLADFLIVPERGHGVGGASSVADPRHGGPDKHSNEYRIVGWQGAARAVTSAHGAGQALADPRPNLHRSKGDHYLTGGHYGVVRYGDCSGAVSAWAYHDNGFWNVADPRLAPTHAPGAACAMPAPNDKLVCRIQALDGTWHRPFTTLELACLQSFIDPEEWFAPGGQASRGERFVLDGASDQRWREAIGNAVPRKAAKAIGTVMGQTILLARSGETFMLGSTPIWVQPVVAALAVALPGDAA